jgi:amino acid transporter
MKNKQIGLLEAFSIGVGGMVGGGIFAVLGLTIELSAGAAPIAFLIAGLIALITAYSYVKLSLRYPSEGGTIEFIVQAFGNGLFSSFINTLMLISYVIMLALYAYAFGSYGSALIIGSEAKWLQDILSVGVIVLFTFINLLGALLTGKAEIVMVLIKVSILLILVLISFYTIDITKLQYSNWMPISSVVTGGFMIFLAYEGFELIANTARDIKDPKVTLPRAYYGSVIFVIILYILIAIVTVGNVSAEQVNQSKEFILAVVAEPFFGHFGFVLVAIAALLSTASAINATIYGSGRTAYIIAKFGEIPKSFEKKVKNGYEGMIIIGLLGIIFSISFDLENISVAGSLGFLIIFSLVNLANFRLRDQTNGSVFISLLGFILSLGAAITLVVYNYVHNLNSLITSLIVIFIVAMFSIIYNKYKKHSSHLSEYMDKDLQEDEEITK